MSRTALCTQEQVLQTAKFDTVEEVGGSDIVTEAISEADSEVLNEYGDPPKRSNFVLDSSQEVYEFRVDKKETYRIDKVYIIDDDRNRIEYIAGTASETNKEYTEDLEFNKITFHADTIGTYSGNMVIIDYVPINIHILARTKAALFLQDQANVTNANEDTPTLGLRLLQRIKRLESSIGIAVGSEDEKNFNPTIGDTIPQRRFWTY